MKYNEKMESLKELEDTAVKQEFKYPMWFESKKTKEVVRFDGLNRGEVIVATSKAFPIGFYSVKIEPHTNRDIWIKVPNPNPATGKDNNKAKNPNSKHYELWEDFEAIDVIKLVLTDEEYKGFLKGNILKYRLRAGKKNIENDNIIKDISKSIDYENELRKP